jgi:hypothetical protein
VVAVLAAEEAVLEASPSTLLRPGTAEESRLPSPDGKADAIFPFCSASILAMPAASRPFDCFVIAPNTTGASTPSNLLMALSFTPVKRERTLAIWPKAPPKPAKKRAQDIGAL